MNIWSPTDEANKHVEVDESPSIVRCQECGTAWPNDEIGCEAMLAHECDEWKRAHRLADEAGIE